MLAGTCYLMPGRLRRQLVKQIEARNSRAVPCYLIIVVRKPIDTALSLRIVMTPKGEYSPPSTLHLHRTLHREREMCCESESVRPGYALQDVYPEVTLRVCTVTVRQCTVYILHSTSSHWSTLQYSTDPPLNESHTMSLRTVQYWTPVLHEVAERTVQYCVEFR